MKEFIFSFPEIKLLKKHSARLEKRFDVRMFFPNSLSQNPSPSDFFVMKIIGKLRNIKKVKKFLKREIDKKTTSKHEKTNGIPATETHEPQESIPIITIDDEADDFLKARVTNDTKMIGKKKSEVPNTNNHVPRNGYITSGSFSHASKNKNKVSNSSSAKQIEVTKSSQTTNVASSPSCSSSEYGSSNSPENDQNADNGIIILSEVVVSSTSTKYKNKSSRWQKESSCLKDSRKVDTSCINCNSEYDSSNSSENNQNADDSIIILSEVIVSSTSATKHDKKSSRWQKETLSLKDLRKVDEVTRPLPDFIPLRVRNKKRKLKGNECVEISALKGRRVLRPIVIDGSNVARHHGRPFNTFSCKGIKICVDYFLNRGHTYIKVILPKKPLSHGPVVTTDLELLDELTQLNMVEYTPARYINGKWTMCYDDRFIVYLASQTNGVIVSNDYYRDIIMESAEFKKTIEERLLMFCFAWDVFMVPEDPLGVKGPRLSEFLSMRV